MIDPWHAALLVAGGAGAGFINAFAGGGSALTVPLLMLTGLDARLANGTNRLAVWAQAVISGHAFHQKGVRPWGLTAKAAVPAVSGALLGSLFATRISPDSTQGAFGVVFLALAALMAFRPSALALTDTPQVDKPGLGAFLSLFAVGIYGGLFQAGVGVPLLLVCVKALGTDLVQGNAIKVVVVGLYTTLVLLVFSSAGQVDWVAGGLLALGGVAGSRLGVRFAVEKGAAIIRWGVVVALGVAGARMLLF